MGANGLERPISKADFARRLEIDRSNITRWIQEGKLHGAALVGDGRAQKIDARVALEQLGRSLDPLQRAINGRADLDQDDDAPDFDLPKRDNVERVRNDGRPLGKTDELKLERIREARLKNEKLERESRAAAGIYVRADDVARALGEGLAGVVRQIEGGLPEISEDVAQAIRENSGVTVEARVIEVALSNAWNRQRDRIARHGEAMLSALPETVTDRLEDPAEGVDDDNGDRPSKS